MYTIRSRYPSAENCRAPSWQVKNLPGGALNIFSDVRRPDPARAPTDLRSFPPWAHARERERQRDRQRDRQRERQTDRQADRQTDRQAGRQAGRQTDRQAGRQTGRQADRQTDLRAFSPWAHAIWASVCSGRPLRVVKSRQVPTVVPAPYTQCTSKYVMDTWALAYRFYMRMVHMLCVWRSKLPLIGEIF